MQICILTDLLFTPNLNNEYLLSVIERTTTPSVGQSEARKGF